MKNQPDLFHKYKFPQTRYQGSKYKLREWIKHSLEKLEFKTAIDAFSGTSSIAYTIKEMDKEVYCNDKLFFNYEVAKALIENSAEHITDEEYYLIIEKHADYHY